MLSAMAGEIALAVTVDDQPPNHTAPLRWHFPHAGQRFSPHHETHRGRPTFTDNSRAVFQSLPSSLLAQSLGATHESITGFVKTQQSIYIPSDADADALADRPSTLRGCAQPRTSCAQVQSVVAQINLQCLGQSPRTSAEVGQTPRAGHQFVDALQRLDGPQQHTPTHAGRLARVKRRQVLTLQDGNQANPGHQFFVSPGGQFLVSLDSNVHPDPRAECVAALADRPCAGSPRPARRRGSACQRRAARTSPRRAARRGPS